VFSNSVIARSRALRGAEAIQLDRHGALRAPRDDNHFENTPSLETPAGRISPRSLTHSSLDVA
jgi:hypothetical protein